MQVTYVYECAFRLGNSNAYSPPVVDELNRVIGVAEAEAPLHFHSKFA